MNTIIWAITLVLVSLMAITYGFLRMVEECDQALEEAGDDYRVCNIDGKQVASFSTDWLAEAYLDDHPEELLVISAPEERYKAALKAIRQQ